jgi:hypothetical protein
MARLHVAQPTYGTHSIHEPDNQSYIYAADNTY